jgi:hypothetical protein
VTSNSLRFFGLGNVLGMAFWACLTAVCLFFVMSCGGDDDSSADPAKEGLVGSTTFVRQGEATVAFADGFVSGTGKVAAKQPLGDLASEKNFSLAFTLEDGGSLALVGYAKDTLEGGVVMKFERTGAAVKATLSVADQSIDLSPVFTNVNATNEIGVTIDIHNGETPAHVIAWTADIANPDKSNPVYESEGDEPSRGAVPGNGQGTFWGLELAKAKVTRADVGEAKFEE